MSAFFLAAALLVGYAAWLADAQGTLPSASGAATIFSFDPVCGNSANVNSNGESYWDPALRVCQTCAANSRYDTTLRRCRCDAGFVESWDVSQAASQQTPSLSLTCVSCASGLSAALSVHLYGTDDSSCIPCGGDQADWLSVWANVTVASAPTAAVPANVNQTVTVASLTTTTAPSSSAWGAAYAPLSAALNGTFAVPSFAPNASLGQRSNATSLLSTCACPQGYGLTDALGGVRLGYFLCRRCTAPSAMTVGHTTDRRDASVCATCGPPLTWSSTRGACVCPGEGDVLVDLSDDIGNVPSTVVCLSAARVASILGGVVTGTVFSTPRNLDNSGQSGVAVRSHYAQDSLQLLSLRCYLRDFTACSGLANLCVLMLYDASSPPCQMHQRLSSLENCRGLGCEIPSSNAWLYYLRSSSDVLYRTNINMQLALQPTVNRVHRIKLVMSSYALNGTFLRQSVVTNEIDPCGLSGSQAREFFVVGSRRSVTCSINLRWFLAAGEPEVHELFVMDQPPNAPDALIDVPVIIDYSNTVDLDPADYDDPYLFRNPSGSGEPLSNAMKRRFFMYDNVAGRTSAGARPSHVTFVRRAVMMFSIRLTHDSRIHSPLLLLQYASVSTAEMAPTTNLHSNELQFANTNETAGIFTMPGSFKANFIQRSGDAIYALRTTLIVLCCVCVLSAATRTYGWMRRQQDMVLGLSALVRFFIHYCNHLSNVFATTTLIAAWAFFLLYKQQSAVEYLLPERMTYLFALLFTATACKFAYVIYKIVEQVNADVFIVDWERPKGMLSNGKEHAVSMWRSTFLANEFNELQTFQGYRLLLSMLISVCFLEGTQYIQASRSVPDSPTQSLVFAVYDPILRVAVVSFFWVVVSVVLYVLEHHVYYRFVSPHPFQCFVDLCSVSNISFLILLEPNWGFYIHGQSIHPFADASIEEFQENLKRESQGHLPPRGLGGIATCQTFEVFIGMQLRQALNVAFASLYQPPKFLATGHAMPATAGQPLMFAPPQFHLFDFIKPHHAISQDIFPPEVFQTKRMINDAIQSSVRQAETALLAKFGLHAIIDFPPSILYMNGPFAGERAGCDLYFIDDVLHWGAFTMGALDFDFFVLYMCLFLAIDSSLQNTFAAMTITAVVDLIVRYYRGAEGQANLAKKLLFDDRFFL